MYESGKVTLLVRTCPWLIVIPINSMGVVLMLRPACISAISSVPYAFSFVSGSDPGHLTYIFQWLLVLSLMLLKKRFVPSYLFSFVAGFAFRKMVDIHEIWTNTLPPTIPLRIFYFAASYPILCFGIAPFQLLQTPGHPN